MNADSILNDTDTPSYDEFGPSDNEFTYRAMSRSAFVSLLLALLSTLAFFFFPMMFLPILAGLLAVSAIVTIKRRPLELTGYPMAVAALVLSVIVFAGASSYHAYVYATEVPEGFQRIGFSDLKARPDHLAQTPVPPEAIALNGEKIFIKGYIHPAVMGSGPIQDFVLVPDMGTCCFGGQPALTDMIEIRLTGDLTTQYNRSKRKLAGVLKVSNRQRETIGGLKGGYYHMDVEILK